MINESQYLAPVVVFEKEKIVSTDSIHANLREIVEQHSVYLMISGIRP